MYPYGTGQFYGQANQQAQQPAMPGQMYGLQPAPNQAQLQPATPLAPIPTGMAPAPVAAPASKAAAIPEKRLSFITQQDQQNFSQLFLASLQPGELALSGQTARLILMRSNLASAVLGDIWQIADTTRSGQLLFPEFCLAMYLCAKVLRGEPVPQDVHPTIRREVADMVDTISFGAPDTGVNPSANAFDQLRQPQQYPSMGYQTGLQPQTTGFVQQPQSMGYNQPQSTGYSQAFQPLQTQQTGGYLTQQTTGYVQPNPTGGFPQAFQPLQPQVTGGLQPQITGGLQPQITGGLQPQITGGLQPQITGGLQPQITGGLQPQITGGLQPQTTGGLQSQYTGGLQPQTTGGLQSQYTGGLQPQSTGQPAGLTPMPTGKPGQWGFVNASTPGLDSFSSQFTPQAATPSTPAMQGNETLSAAISKMEKQKYDQIFTTWDRSRQGTIDGATAIEIFTKSGLDRGSLERIWALCDQSDKGKLGRDEFAVAMHLIYRKLNGYDIPAQLPPELVPPSSRHLQDSLNQMREHLKQPTRSSTGQVSYLKQRSFTESKPKLKHDATVFKNDDNQLGGGYVSAARHRAPASKPTPSRNESTNIDQLAKQVREAKIKIDALNARGEEEIARNTSVDSGNLRAIEELKTKIRGLQSELDSSPTANGGQSGTVDRQQLIRKLDELTDALPHLTSSIRQIEQDIAAAKIELMRRKFEKANPGVSIPGTGPNGSITEADRAAARRRAELRARMSAITGRSSSQSNAATAFEEFEKELVEAGQAAEKMRDTNEQSLRALEESVQSTKRDLDRQLRAGVDDQSERNRRRWEEAVGVEDDVKRFILELRKPTIASPEPSGAAAAPTKPFSPAASPAAAPPAAASPSAQSSASATPPRQETPQERIARIRAEARRKLNDSMAKRGIHKATSNATESSNQPASPSPAPAEPEAPAAPTTPAAPAAPTAPVAPAAPAVPTVVEPKPAETDDEEARIMKQLEEKRKHIERLEEQKKIASREKEQRLADLQRQYEELELKERSLSAEPEHDSKPEPKPEPKPKVPVATSTVRVPKATSTVRTASPAVAAPVVPAAPPAAVPATPTVPAVPATPAVPAAPAAPPAPASPEMITGPVTPKTMPSAASTLASEKREPIKQDYNPFAASMAPATSSAPASKPAAAPAPPRSFAQDDDDEGWGASEEESDDDQPRGAATPAQLASLLFGSMGPQRPQATGAAAPESASAPAEPAVPVSEAPPVPAAAPEAPFVTAAVPEPAAAPYPVEAAPAVPPVPAPAVPVAAPFEAVPAPPVAPYPTEAPVPVAAPSEAAPAAPAAPPPAVPYQSEASEFDFESEFKDAQETMAPASFEPTAAPAFAPPPAPAFEPPVAPESQAPPPPAAAAPPPPPPPPAAAAPPPPPPPAAAAPPPPPPPAAAAPPPPPPAAAPAAPSGAPAGVPSMANVLGDITRGKALRKVAPDQQRISSTELGRVV